MTDGARGANGPGTRRALLALIAVVVVCALDLAVPLGVAMGAFHVLPLLLTLGLRRRLRIGVTMVASGAVVMAALLGDTPGNSAMAWTNRGISVVVIWVTQLLIEVHARMEERDARRRANFEQMVTEVRDYAVYALDPAGRVTSWNAGAERITGYGADEVIGQSIEIFHPPTDAGRQAAARLLATARREGRSSVEGWRFRKDGTTFWAEVTITAYHDATTGELSGLSMITRDATERRQRNAMLASKTTDLEHFVFMAAHDLKAPLRHMRTFAELLGATQQLDEAGKQHVTQLTASADRLHRQTTNLVEYARLESTADPEPVALDELVASVIEDVVTPDDDAIVETEPLPTVLGFPDHLRSLFQNLLSNALKYRHQDRPARVRVSSLSEDETIVLHVDDDGIGIAEEMRERVFHPFQRELRTPDVSGDGMGLAICRKIAQMHGGTIAVESLPEGGSRFVVHLPKAALSVQRATAEEHS
ncbi:MAG: PAS domain-containing sensor histidine kinase [Polyangiaceae bacterium]